MYTLRLQLDLCESEKRFLSKSFHYATTIQNKLVRYSKGKLISLYSDKEYRNARLEYGKSKFSDKKVKLTAKQKDRKKYLTDLMQSKLIEYGLLKSDLETYVKPLQSKYKHYINSQQAQKLVNNVYTGIEKVLYDDGNKLHFKKYNDFDCINQKANYTGIVIKNWRYITFMKHKFKIKPLKPDKKNKRNLELMDSIDLTKDVVYCSFKRIEFSSGFRYYVIITLRTEVPKKIKQDEVISRTGIDLGPSTIATCSDNSLRLQELAPKSLDYEKEIRHLQKLVTNSMKIHNPNNYNQDGTTKRGKHDWIVTKTCKKLKRRIRILYRKQTAYVQDSHNRLINDIIKETAILILEPMNIRSLQKKVKKTERSDKLSDIKQKDGSVKQVHKYKKKKRFGHSVKNRSPGYLQSNLKKRCEQYDIPVYEIDPFEFRASQLHHDTGEYVKHELKERFKEILGHIVQRDLYSAFLIYNALLENLKIPDLDRCELYFNNFIKMHDKLIKEMKQQGISYKPSFGF